MSIELSVLAKNKNINIMFLSDELEEIYNESGNFDLDTCNKIIIAVGDRIKSELTVILEDVQKRHVKAISSKVLYSRIDSIVDIFLKFTNKHGDMPEVLYNKVMENMYNYKILVSNSSKLNQ